MWVKVSHCKRSQNLRKRLEFAILFLIIEFRLLLSGWASLPPSFQVCAPPCLFKICGWFLTSWSVLSFSARASSSFQIFFRALTEGLPSQAPLLNYGASFAPLALSSRETRAACVTKLSLIWFFELISVYSHTQHLWTTLHAEWILMQIESTPRPGS